MRNVRVALAQIAPRLGEIEANLETHLENVREARRGGANLVVFPELSLTGYLLRDQVPEVALRIEGPRFRSLARASRTVDLMLGFVEETAGHRYHNATAYLSRGRIVHVHRKVYLPTYGMFEEGRDFAAGERIRAFDAPFGRAAMLICEDCWHPSCAFILAQQGMDVLLAASSGPTRGARPGKGITSLTVWHDLLRVTAQLETAFVVYVNRVGYEDGLNFGGGSLAVDPFGRPLVTLPALEPALEVVELDAGVLRRARIAYPLLRDENLELAAREIDRIRRLRFDLPAAAKAAGPDLP
jgi:predicted amidohydrolase